ncbi:HelD family protein [Streptomyces gardneri]|uniref:HelD family protein n=1 Tax=Streptomyces gardneri TaxID=66892 RepID=UPI0035D7FC14
MLATEQRAVDRAYECLEYKRLEAVELKQQSAAASGKDAIDVNRAWERELESLDLGRNSLVFMRADVDEPEGRATHYIGRRSVFDQEHNAVVLAWNAPEAIRWRLADERDPGDVKLLRQIVCDRNVVRRYFDLHGKEDPNDAPEPDVEANAAGRAEPTNGESSQEPTASLDGDVMERSAWQDPLLDELDRARDGSMHDIVETIRREQLRLVTESTTGVLIVQGGPGTGKTAVGMHRASWLLDNDYLLARDVLVIGPNRAFLDYVGTALAELGVQGVAMLEIAALWSAADAPRDPWDVASVKSDPRMSDVLRRAVDAHTTHAVDRLSSLVGGSDFTFECRRREVIVPVEEIANIAARSLIGDGPYRVRRERCVRQLVEHFTQLFLGLLPGPADVDYFQEIRELRPVARLLRRVAPELSAGEVLRRLLAGGPVTVAATEGILTVEEQSALVSHHEQSARASKGRELSREDHVCLDELAFILSGRPERVYGHLIVDEAQDLTPMEARSLARRCPGGAMTVLGDLAQATGAVPYPNWDVLGSVLATKDGWRVAELDTGFRVPGEVMEFVRRLGAQCAPGVVVPKSVRETDNEVRVLEGLAPAERAALHAREAAAVLDCGSGTRSTVVIVPEALAWRESVLAALGEGPSVHVITAETAKGLEFDHVVVVEPAAIVDEHPSGLRRLYVALTRCTQSLTVVHQRPLPRWIGGPEQSVPTPKFVGENRARKLAPGTEAGGCTRYRSDGTRCRNATREPDGWCRTGGCEGFRSALPTSSGASSSLRLPSDAEHGQRLRLTPEKIADIRIGMSARGAFTARHGGRLEEAAVELRSMLEPLLEKGRHVRSREIGWMLDLDGYRLTLDADGRTVTAYSAAHKERSYAQYVAGVPSRVGSKARAARRSALTPPRQEPGTELTGESAVRALAADGLHITATACGVYEKTIGQGRLADTEFVRRLRDDLTSALSEAPVLLLEHRVILMGHQAQWVLSRDGSILVTVRKPHAALPPSSHGRQGNDPLQERETMPSTSSLGDRSRQASPELAALLTAQVAAARKDRSHEALRYRLLSALYESSAEVGDDTHVDAWSHTADGTTLFDVLGEGGHAYPHIREAALQLQEAAHLHPGGQAEYLVAVLRDPPAEPWIAGVVDQAFSVSLAWWDGDSWCGSGARRITGVTTEEGIGSDR